MKLQIRKSCVHLGVGSNLIQKHAYNYEMEIGRKFNALNITEYFFYIDHYKEYSDFNTLGLYRSIVENQNLTIDEKITVRNYAHKTFIKTFNFLQVKDPKTFIEVEYLGQELTKGDEQRIWEVIRNNQQQILASKRIKHRNFGIYSKHNCPYDDCTWKGVMLRHGSNLVEFDMFFTGDRNRYQQKQISTETKIRQTEIR